MNFINVIQSWVPSSPREWVLYFLIFVLVAALFFFHKGLMKAKELIVDLTEENRQLKKVCENHGFDIKFAEAFGDLNE